jgi:TIR domain
VLGLVALTAALRDYQERRDAYSVEAEGRRFVVGLDSELTDVGRGYRESAPRTSRVDLVRAAAGRPRLVWDEAALRDHANTLERAYLFTAALAAVAAVTLAGAARSRSRGASDLQAAPRAAQPVDEPRPVPHRRFRVALSFPGEVRDRAERLAELLEPALGRDRIFFDRWYAAELARPDMDLYLQNIYRSHAELLVVMLCADYQRKEWCGLEWRVVRDLIKARESGRIMFLRFDAVSIDGLLSIDGYLDIAEMNDEAVAAAVLSRTTAPDATRSTLK